jgi:prevent-host-death family protein
MTDVPIGEAAENLATVVARARQAEQVITVNGEPAAVVVEPHRYAVMKKTLDILDNPDLLADLAAGKTRKRFTGTDVAQLLLQRSSVPADGPSNSIVIRRCQELLDSLSPGMPTAVIAPPPPSALQQNMGSTRGRGIRPYVEADQGEMSPPHSAAPDLEAMWSVRREPFTETDRRQHENSGEISGRTRHEQGPTVVPPDDVASWEGDELDDSRRRSVLYRALMSSTAMRALIHRREEDG